MEQFLYQIIDYLIGNELRLGVVVKENEGGRYQVKGLKNEITRISRRQILTAFGPLPGKNPDDFSTVLIALKKQQEAIDEAKSGVDSQFLWESCPDELKGTALVSAASLSSLYFGDDSPLHLAAILRGIGDDPVHFQRQALEVQIRTKEDAEEILRLRQMRAERAQKRERTIQWLNQALSHQGADAFSVPEEQELPLKQALDFLMRGSNSEMVNLLATARPKTTAREAALQLLHKTNRLPENADEFLLVNGIHAGFADEVVAASQALVTKFNSTNEVLKAGRRIIDNEEIFSIDDPETREIDDALSLRKEGDIYHFGVYIADPAAYIQKDDVLDQAAAERPLSLYLPTTTVMMFPDSLSCELASLNERVQRPAMAFLGTLSQEGELLSWEIAPALVTVNHHLTYDQVEALLRGEDSTDNTSLPESLKESLRQMAPLSDRLRRIREEGGAVTFNRPEIRISVHNEEISVKVEDQDTPARQLVSEFMVLCNALAARYALHNEIPVIYRVQDPPSGHVESVRVYDPYFFEQQVKHMKRTRLSTYPQAHFGLGLDLYIQISSPLRRYADLVLHRQLAAHCQGKPLPYTQEELFVVLDNVDRTASQNKSYEKEAKNYWLLEYLRRNCIGKEWNATVMRVEGSMVLAELEGLCLRGVVMTRDKPTPGEHIRVTIQEAIPDGRRLVLARIG